MFSLTGQAKRELVMAMQMRLFISAVAVAASFWSGCSADPPYCFPHDFKQPNLPRVYLLEHSRGHNVTVSVDGTAIWKGVVSKSEMVPSVQTVGVPAKSQRACQLKVTGGPYSAESSVDWQKGKAFVVHFRDERVILYQKDEPLGSK